MFLKRQSGGFVTKGKHHIFLWLSNLSSCKLLYLAWTPLVTVNILASAQIVIFKIKLRTQQIQISWDFYCQIKPVWILPSFMKCSAGYGRMHTSLKGNEMICFNLLWMSWVWNTPIDKTVLLHVKHLFCVFLVIFLRNIHLMYWLHYTLLISKNRAINCVFMCVYVD